MSGAHETVTVVGAGYVGLVTAVGLATLGREVHLVERRTERLQSLLAGRAPIHEPGLQQGLARALGAGRLTVGSAANDMNGIVLICVGTPIGDDGRSDLSQIRAALTELEGPLGRDAVMVIRSTLPIGSTHTVVEWAGMPAGRLFTNPEFLRQGTAVADFARPSRIVIGRFREADDDMLARVIALYEGIEAPRLVVDVTAAEIIKNGANAFLALKLSFANEIAALCEETGADVDEVLRGITADPRIGSTYMRPSFGFGGSCLPKELLTLAVAGHDAGLAMHMTTAASAANGAHQARFLDRIEKRLGALTGRTIGLLGLAYKADTDDVRDSPAVRLALALMARGATVRANDPAANTNAQRDAPDLVVVETASEVFDGADAVVVATEWPEFRTLAWADAKRSMSQPIVFDGRRLLDAAALKALGYEVIVVGDGRT
jgi:UDPglucose 6-dehydrogenase